MPETTDTRPKTPGWYWVQAFDESPWLITKAGFVRGRLCALDPHMDTVHPIAIDDPFWDDCKWLGPITPADAVEMARLRAAREESQSDA